MRLRDPARAGVAEREIAHLAHGKTARIPEPVSSRKSRLQRWSVRRYRRALSHRREQRFTASLTAEGAGHHPTDDEADDSIPDDVAFRTICVPSRGKILKRACSGCAAPDVRRPMRRRQDSPFSWRPWVCLRPTLRLPVTVTGNRLQRTGEGIHGLNQRREASQVSRTPPRKRHQDPGAFEATTKAKLLRLAHHRNCSVPALIGDLAAPGDGTAVRQGPQAVLRRGIAAATRVSTVTGNHNNRCTEMNDQATMRSIAGRCWSRTMMCLRTRRPLRMPRNVDCPSDRSN
jgi:hypothetical protein